jgi:L-malate glycosyltransferase
MELTDQIGRDQYSEKLTVIQLSSEATWRGGEQQIAYLIEELQQKGVETIAVVKAKSSFEKHCQENGIKYYSLPFGNSIDLITAWRLRAIAKKVKANIVHAHSSKSHSIAVLATLFGLGTPLILSRRVDFRLSDSLYSRWKYNHSAIKKILCVSNAIKAIVKPHLEHPEKCITIHSGIDLSKFGTRPAKNLLRVEYTISDDTFLVGNTSALAPHKDYVTFIDTIGKLVSSGASVKGMIIGKGELERELKAYVEKINLSQHIIFTGFRQNIKQLLPCLDVFLITSNEEGLGTSVLDAFASGVPVVATKAGGIPEMVIDGVTGVLANIKDSQTLSEGVNRVISDTGFRELLIHNAHEASKNFTKEKTAQKTLAVYHEIANA